MTEPPLIPEEVGIPMNYISFSSHLGIRHNLLCTIEEAERTDIQQVHNGYRKRVHSNLDAGGTPLTISKFIGMTEMGYML